MAQLSTTSSINNAEKNKYKNQKRRCLKCDKVFTKEYRFNAICKACNDYNRRYYKTGEDIT